MTILFQACQSEENITTGENPNASSSTSTTAQNFQRVAQNDGSSDDFLDGNSCTELLFPITASINGQQITLISEADFALALQILGEFNNDIDVVEFNFPINVRTSNYTEVTVNTQSEFDALVQECQNLENQGRDAISCIDFDFPITMLTYDVSLEQTGSVVVQSEEQLFNFMTGLDGDELFAVNYPISATLSNGTSVQLNSDAEFQNAISTCVQFEEEQDAASDLAADVEAIISESTFRVESFVVAGVNTANDFANWSIEFTNDLKAVATNTVNTTLGQIEGTYSVTSETEVFFNIVFANNTAVSALGNEWIVESFSSTTVNLRSKTDASITLTFEKL